MKKYKIACICQIYNELEKGNLERFFEYTKPLVDVIVVYDDCSTDGSYEYALKQTPHVIRGTKNDFSHEIKHKQKLLEKTLQLSPDFILWLDADEVLTAGAKDILQESCQYCIQKKLDGLSFHEINLWRSNVWCRIDNLYNDGWLVKLWRVTPEIKFTQLSSGLHQNLVPSSIRKTSKTKEIAVIHYGFATELNLAYKYLTYKSHGQSGYMLDRLVSEEKLLLKKVSEKIFPKGLITKDTKPKKLSLVESFSYLEKYKRQVFRPKYSIICLIYKSVDWLKFVYEQVYRYTDMKDKEFYFIANDANENVLNYLKNNYIPHYIWNNLPQQKKEWYINNVYRAWNFGAKKAKGDFLVLINSDMAFSKNWFENLLRAYNGSNCVVSRLVEAGKFKSGLHGIEKDFGQNFNSYQEKAFQKYAQLIAVREVKNSGLYMPLLIRKEHFVIVGGYPEGNVVLGSNIFRPKIAEQGQQLVSGDTILMEKLKTKGIIHQTVFDSISYHFQCGEMDSKPSKLNELQNARIAICNDLITGVMGEKVLWGYFLENLPSSVGIDKSVMKKDNNYSQKAGIYIQKHYPQTQIIIQNATFINLVDRNKYTIVFLQDNLRAMGKSSKQQEKNLLRANKLVTNSLQTALSYPEFNFEIIPVGVDTKLFYPMNRKTVRQELGFKSGKIGIFVGEFSEIKGWSKVKKCIERFPQIIWILVSKRQENYHKTNTRVFNRVSQKKLAKLLNCADFFIIGSPVETQCLAAVEACLCNIPVVMPNVGVFQEFSQAQKNKVGVFGDDLIEGVNKITRSSFSPREVIIKRKITINDSMKLWKELIENSFQEIAIKKYQKSGFFEPEKINLLMDKVLIYRRELDKRIETIKSISFVFLVKIAKIIIPNRIYQKIKKTILDQ